MATETIVDTADENPNTEKDTDNKADEFLPPPPSDVGNNAEGVTQAESETEVGKLDCNRNGDANEQHVAMDSTAIGEPSKSGDETEAENSAAQQSLANDIATDVLASFHSSENQVSTQVQEQVRNSHEQCIIRTLSSRKSFHFNP